MNCTQFKEQVGAYAIGALDPDEHAACDRHLEEDKHEGCLAALSEANEAAVLLARALPPLNPSDTVWAAVEQRTAVARRPPATLGWMGWAAAAAMLLALVWVARDRQRIQGELAQASTQRGADAADRAACAKELAEARADTRAARLALEMLPRSESRLIALAPQGDAAATAKVILDPSDHRAFLVGKGMNAPSGKDYELWLIRGDKKIAAGLLRGDPDPNAPLVAAIDSRLLAGAPPDAIAVTLEPTGGGSSPTGPIVLVGKI